MFDKIASVVVGIAMAISGFFTAPSQVKDLQQEVASLKEDLHLVQEENIQLGATNCIFSS